MRKPISIIAGIALVYGALWFASENLSSGRAQTTAAAGLLSGLTATLHKSPTCGCCDGYAEFLASHGVKVTVISSDAELARTRRELGLPGSALSCHTVELAGYVIEGHVPLAALERLLTERPPVAGLALPGMPVGTPGMPGEQTGPIEVLEFDEAGLRPFMTL